MYTWPVCRYGIHINIGSWCLKFFEFILCHIRNCFSPSCQLLLLLLLFGNVLPTCDTVFLFKHKKKKFHAEFFIMNIWQFSVFQCPYQINEWCTGKSGVEQSIWHLTFDSSRLRQRFFRDSEK